MDHKLWRFVFVATLFVCCNGSGSFEPTNYDLSRRKVGFGLKEIAQLFLGGDNYGQYPQGPGHYPANHYPGGHYPSGGGHYPNGGEHYPSGGGVYPSGSGGYYPPPGPPGAHPGCPLCDSSVYSYCSYKQAHDSCCCDGNSILNIFACRRVDCRKLYANSCDEYNLISECCCVDVQKKSNLVGPIPVPVLAPVGPAGPVVAVAIKK